MPLVLYIVTREVVELRAEDSDDGDDSDDSDDSKTGKNAGKKTGMSSMLNPMLEDGDDDDEQATD